MLEQGQLVDPYFYFSLPVLLAGLVLIGAGAIQGAAGFGFSMLAAPLLAVIDTAFVPGPMLFMAMSVSFWGMVSERRNVDYNGLGAALLGRFFASILAVILLSHLDQKNFSLVFGIAVLMAVLFSLVGFRFKPTPPILLVAGSLSGLMGTLTSIGAPPMALAFQNSSGPVMRSTLNSFFAIGAAFSLLALWFSGYFGWQQLMLALSMLPFGLVGFLFSGWGKAIIDRNRIKHVVFIVSSISAVTLILRAF